LPPNKGQLENERTFSCGRGGVERRFGDNWPHAPTDGDGVHTTQSFKYQARPPILITEGVTDTMLNGFLSALFVLAGGLCAMAGYLVGSWHQRRAMEADLAHDLFGPERGFDFGDEPLPPRDSRLN
jgi:hypothetical protein